MPNGSSRVASIDAARGTAMLFVCLAHFTNSYFFLNGKEGIGRNLVVIGMIASPSLYDPETERPAFAALPYGSSWRRGAFTCRSRTTGVTCRNGSGHGLFLSRQTWRVW